MLFVDDLPRMAAFYEAVAGMRVVEREDGWVRMRLARFELVIHAASATARTQVTSPPALREDTPVKLFLSVASLARARRRAAALGGGFPVDRQWAGPGFLANDGFDPEGNVVQLRELGSR